MTRKGRQPSDGVRLLAAFKEIFASCKSITSKEVMRKLATDELSVWAEYSGGKAITERQIAHLLAQYEIHPRGVGPEFSRVRRCHAEDFQDKIRLAIRASAHPIANRQPLLAAWPWQYGHARAYRVAGRGANEPAAIRQTLRGVAR